jgi:Winged helix DNA-binding domain
MTLSDISRTRLFNQQIAGTKFKSPQDMVSWMGAIQAQDYQMVKWALGVRLPRITDKEIETALDKGQIIRTHLLRPTWHLVSAEDIYWMLELTAPHIKSSLNSSANLMGLTAGVITKCNNIIEKALRDGNHLTRDEIMALLNKAKISTESFRSIHIMYHAELSGLVCNGIRKGKNNTYALLAERVPKKKTIPREEALAKLAKRYFSSHCPATIKDFIWWSGLPVKDARNALEMIKSNFISETIGAETYWFTNSFSIPKNNIQSVYLLPAFDEFLISYKDRTAAFPKGNHKRAFTNNGIFRPVIVINGHVTGLWKRTIKKDTVLIETCYLQAHNKATKSLVEKATKTYGDFLNKKTEVVHSIG